MKKYLCTLITVGLFGLSPNLMAGNGVEQPLPQTLLPGSGNGGPVENPNSNNRAWDFELDECSLDPGEDC
jgi:hypothetical protein